MNNQQKQPKNPNIGFTSAHTILKNEKHHIDTWLEYTKDLDYRVLLDTGSTDGSYEYLLELSKNDNSIIVEQKIFIPWRFDVARTYNLNMVPKETVWCLSPDLDEYFSRNTLDELEKYIKLYPNMTNMSCARLDIYSKEVFVGQPKHLGTNKIFKFGDYRWKSRIFEHLSWVHKDKYESEIYNNEVFLIHNQDYWKQSRPDQYRSMLMEIWQGPKDVDDYGWCLWFLVNDFFREKNTEMFIKTAVDYVKYGQESNKVAEVYSILQRFKQNNEVPLELRNIIDVQH